MVPTFTALASKRGYHLSEKQRFASKEKAPSPSVASHVPSLVFRFKLRALEISSFPTFGIGIRG